MSTSRVKAKDGRMVVTDDAILQDISVGAKTATFNTPGVDIGNSGVYRGHLAITAASGTSPTLTVTIQTSHDNGATDAWRTVGSAFAQQTGVADVRQCFAGCDRYIRANCVIGGTTPSFTFSVSGECCGS